jgi:hypothetical protein
VISKSSSGVAETSYQNIVAAIKPTNKKSRTTPVKQTRTAFESVNCLMMDHAMPEADRNMRCETLSSRFYAHMRRTPRRINTAGSSLAH